MALSQKLFSASKTTSLPMWTIMGARGHSGIVHHLVGQCNRRAVGESGWPVLPLQEKGQELPFALHKDGASPHKAEAILAKDGLRFFYHLHMETDKVREEEDKTGGCSG